LSLKNDKEQAELSGSSLLVYWYLLRRRQGCGVREVQRALGFSSSSTAHYHLEKLANRRFLVKDCHGNYKINEKVKVGSMSPFVFVHGVVFPMQLIYAIATTGMCILFLAMFSRFLTSTAVVALSPGIVASIIFWYDAIRVWRSLPSFKGGVR
jgi:hypothetical protein